MAATEVPLAHSHRQHHREAGTAARSLVDPYVAPVRSNDGLADSQPEPMAGHVLLLSCARAEEGLEDTLAILGTYARSCILHGELQVARSDTGRYPDGALRRRVLGGVLEQIGQHSFDSAWIYTQSREPIRHIKAHHALAE